MPSILKLSIGLWLTLFNFQFIAAESKGFTVTLHGRYHWELYSNIDNSENSEVLAQNEKIQSEVTLTYQDMIDSLNSDDTGDIATQVGSSVFKVEKVTSVEVKGELETGELEPKINSEYESIPEFKLYHTIREREDEIEVGPHSILKLYRLVFVAPGITYKTDKLRENPDAVDDVDIVFTGTAQV